MELEERKKRILGVIVRSYISNGEPIGSKTVLSELNTNLSSATVRNEMATLEELGLLSKPHTSAGRIPSAQGYKMYIHELMQSYSLSRDEVSAIDRFVDKISLNIGRVITSSAIAAAEITGCAAVAITPASGGMLQMFEAVIAGKRVIAVLAVSDLGIAKTKTCILNNEPGSENVLILNNILNFMFSGKSPSEITDEQIKQLSEEIKRSCPGIKSVIPFLIEFMDELRGYDVYVTGENNLLDYPEFSDIDAARNYMSLLTDHDKMAEMIRNADNDIEVSVFGENSGMSMVSQKLSYGKSNGLLCAFGPTRMDYAKILAKMSYFTRTLSDIINKNLY